MSTTRPNRQLSASDAARALLASPSKLSVGAAGCMLLFLFLPAVYVSSTMMGMAAGGSSISGSQLAGWAAWLSFAAFAMAATSRFVPPLAPYKKLLDLAAFTLVIVALLYATFGGPLASAAQQINQMQHQFGGLPGVQPGAAARTPFASISIIPHIGALSFLVAPVALFLAQRRERVLANLMV